MAEESGLATSGPIVGRRRALAYGGAGRITEASRQVEA